MSVQFKKRLGSTIRECNINIVIEMLKEGKSENDILTLLAMSFCQDTRVDYLNTAKEKLKMDNNPIAQQAQKQTEENITRELDQRKELTDKIKADLTKNPEITLAYTVEKYASKDIDEDEISLCYGNAKEYISRNKPKEKPFNDLGLDLQVFLKPNKDKPRKEQIEFVKNAKINETLRHVWLKDLGDT